ncbi:MAG: single-stranded DNA-binding protein [Acidimicrobiales bacterium]
MDLPMNVVVLGGHLSRPPERRQLPSGDGLVAYEVTVPRAGQRAESVPVVWFGAPATAVDLEPGAGVVVVGRVRRRFFRAGGATQSRTEVVAERVVPAHHSGRVRRALAAALAPLEDERTTGPW